MSQPAVFQASYSDWRLVRTRKVVQIIFEIPLEQSDQAYDVLGGMPDASKERWFAIAALKQPNEKEPIRQTSPRPSRKWHELSAGQQAGLLCAKESFQRFMYESAHTTTMNQDETVEEVREICGVGSRSDIDATPQSREAWESLVNKFRIWEMALEPA